MIYKSKKYEYKVEVNCKDCNRLLRKERYTLKKWTGRCQPCAVRLTGLSCKGIKRSDEHRRKTGIASLGRKKSIGAIEKARQNFTGKNNPNWNPNREEVIKKERARKEMYSLVHNFIKRANTKKYLKSSQLLGYSPLDLYKHLEKNFKEGMSWENRGQWHIDHIKPVSLFVKEGILEPRIVNALSNLQPLWAFDNLSKYNH